MLSGCSSRKTKILAGRLIADSFRYCTYSGLLTLIPSRKLSPASPTMAFIEKLRTRAVHGGDHAHPGAVSTPIVHSATFRFPSLDAQQAEQEKEKERLREKFEKGIAETPKDGDEPPDHPFRWD